MNERYFLLFRQKREHNFPPPGTVQFDKNDSLPVAQHRLAILYGEAEGCPDHRRKDVIRYMRRVVRMAIFKLWNNRIEGIEKIKIRAGVQIGDCQRSGRMEDEEMANSSARFLISKLLSTDLCEIDDFLFAFCANV